MLILLFNMSISLNSEDDIDGTEHLITPDESNSENYEDALERIGYGKFHYFLMAILAWAVSSDAVEIVCVSFILPSIECDFHILSWEKGWVNAVIFLGMMIGGFTWGTLSDIRGRRLILIICLLINGVSALSSSASQSFWVFVALRCLSGIGVGGSYPVVFSYLSEFQPRSHRGMAMSLLSCFWMLAGMATAGLAWGIIPHRDMGVFLPEFVYNSWRIFIALCSVPSLTSALFVLALPESPKYLLRVNQKRKATEILNAIAVSNGRSQSGEEFVGNIHLGKHQEETVFPGCANALRKMMATIATLFKSKWRRISLVYLCVNFTLSFGYYGILLWVPELFTRMERTGGSVCHVGHLNTSISTNTTHDPCSPEIMASSGPYWEAFLVNLANLPGNLVSILLIDKVGRKVLLASSMVLTGVCVFFIALIKSKSQTVIITCLFSGVSAAGWNALGVLGVETLPTSLRATAMGLAQGCGRIGSITGNVLFGVLIDVHCIVPLFLAAVLLAIGGLSGLLLPNTTKKNTY